MDEASVSYHQAAVYFASVSVSDQQIHDWLVGEILFLIDNLDKLNALKAKNSNYVFGRTIHPTDICLYRALMELKADRLTPPTT